MILELRGQSPGVSIEYNLKLDQFQIWYKDTNEYDCRGLIEDANIQVED